MLSGDKHWHAELGHCLALLESYDLSTDVSAVTGHSGVRVTVLANCQALLYGPVTASVKYLHHMWNIPEQCSSTACQCSHSRSDLARNLHSEHWFGLQGDCLGHLEKVFKALKL
mgnify:CR=1 FL=1